MYNIYRAVFLMTNFYTGRQKIRYINITRCIKMIDAFKNKTTNNLTIYENSDNGETSDGERENCASPSGSRKKSRGVWSILFLPLIFAYCEALLRVFNGNYIPAEYIYPCVFGISAGLLAAAALSFFPPKVNRVCTAVILFVMGVAFASECLIKKNLQIYMTPASVFAGVGGVVGKYTSNLMASMLGGVLEIILFFAPFLIYAVLGKKLTFAPSERVSPVCSVVSALCAAALFGTGVFLSGSGNGGDKYEMHLNFDSTVESFGLLTAVRLNIRNSFSAGESESGFVAEISQTVTSEAQTEYISEDDEDIEAIPVNAANVYPTETETDAASETAKKTAEKSDLGKNKMDIDFDAALSRNPNAVISELNNYVRSLTPSNKNDYTGLFEGKNLILICAEAFSDAVVSEELTPTLYRMSHNGIYFSDYYQPTWGGSTTTGEFSFVTGLVPESGLESMLKAQDNNNYFTLGNQLQRQNYTSCAFHNGQFDYYSRNLTHTNLGYSNFLGFGNGLEKIIRNYAEDSEMLSGTIDDYIDKQPFSLYYMTVSGHFSYKADNHKVKENLQRVYEVYGNKYKATTNYYLCYQMELDKALNELLKKLEDAGIADDTVICLTADHYPYGLELNQTFGNTEDYVTDLYGYKHSAPWEKDHNTLILWSGCLENDCKDYACEISSPTYSLDIVPTLSNLFGLEYDSRLLVGRDVFSDADPLVIWNNYSWRTDKGSYNSRTRTFTPAEGSSCGDEYAGIINRVVRNKIYFSYQTVDNDYYGALFGSDEIR